MLTWFTVAWSVGVVWVRRKGKKLKTKRQERMRDKRQRDETRRDKTRDEIRATIMFKKDANATRVIVMVVMSAMRLFFCQVLRLRRAHFLMRMSVVRHEEGKEVEVMTGASVVVVVCVHGFSWLFQWMHALLARSHKIK